MSRQFPPSAFPCVLALTACVLSAAGIEPLAPYRFQPGDEIQIQVLNMPELSATAKVRPDGRISVMLLDDVEAANRTVTEVRQTITDGYSKQYREPRVGVFARSFVNRTVYVSGEVSKAGAVQLAAGMTAMQAVIQAGGFLPAAKIDDAVLLRQGEAGNRKVMPLKLHEVLKGSGPDTALLPADVIYIPKSDIKVYVGGEVSKPGLVPLDGELTALTAVMNAGGFLDTASAKGAVLIRNKGDRTPTTIPLKLDAVMKGLGPDTPLQAYDIVYVPKSGIAKIDKAVDQYIRRVVPFTLTGGFSYILGGNFGGTGFNCFY